MTQKEGLLTYEQAAVESGLTVNFLRRKASRKTHPRDRLPVVRLGHKTVRIRWPDFVNWLNRR